MKLPTPENPAKISLLASDVTGNYIRSILLGQALKKLNYEVEIIAFKFGESLYAVPPADISVVAIPATNYPGFLSSAKIFLDKIDGDLIYAVKPRPTSFGLALLKNFFDSRPLLLDVDDWELSWHGGDDWKYRPTIKQFARDIFKKDGELRYPDHPLYLQWMEKLAQKADAITIHTQFLKERFGGVYLPNGKDTSLFDPSRYNPETSRERYNLSGYRILMFPGAPRPYKGLEDVLEALDRLNEPDLRLAIVGGSPYDNYDNELIERWGRWIIKLPSYPMEVMPEIVAAAHVVVVPQRDTAATRAQFPLKLTDGMAMAKPVLATQVGDIPEILGGTGYLVEPMSPDQLADKIQWIFQHFDEAQEQGKQAREKCVKLYSIEAMADILAQVIALL